MKDGNTYYMACTGGGGYPLRRSTDLVNWQRIGSVMPTAANRPAWAASDFWAPELHKVGSTYVAYFSARHTNGVFAIGAATSSVPQGPYQARPTPLLQTASPGVIDAHFFEAPNGTRYLLWKPDSNAIGQQTSIRIQPLTSDGLSLTGSPTTLLVNDRAWEGNLIEGPWMIHRNGFFYLFYSANGYASPNYAIGVARATSPTGPFTKRATPILVTRGAWAGPGHGSVVVGPSGDWVHVFHAWQAGNVGQAPGRLVLVDRVTFENDWPVMYAGPSTGTQPLP
jgi:beta-xylosidase